MAEIHVEKKKPVWPWILLIVIIVLALLYFFVWADNGTSDDLTEDEDNIQKIEQYETEEYANNSYPQNAIGRYLSYVDRGSDDDLLGNDPQSQQKAMMLLLEAVEEKMIEVNQTPGSEMDDISQWDSQRQIQDIKRTGKIIVDNLKKIQMEQYPQLENPIEELRADVENLNPNSNEDQLNIFLSDFFTKAADILRGMDSEIQNSSMTPSGSDTARYSTDVDTISTN